MTKKTPNGKDEQEKKENKAPIRKAFTIEKANGAWSQVTIRYQGNNIVNVERTVPDLKAIALERFKIEAFNYWSRYDEAV